jgi:hypothetical protein
MNVETIKTDFIVFIGNVNVINMLSALAKYVINRLIHGLFHIALVISPRLISSLWADIKVLSCLAEENKFF